MANKNKMLSVPAGAPLPHLVNDPNPMPAAADERALSFAESVEHSMRVFTGKGLDGVSIGVGGLQVAVYDNGNTISVAFTRGTEMFPGDELAEMAGLLLGAARFAAAARTQSIVNGSDDT